MNFKTKEIFFSLFLFFRKGDGNEISYCREAKCSKFY